MRSTHYNYKDQRINEPVGRFLRPTPVTQEVVPGPDIEEIAEEGDRGKSQKEKPQIPCAPSTT